MLARVLALALAAGGLMPALGAGPASAGTAVASWSAGPGRDPVTVPRAKALAGLGMSAAAPGTPGVPQPPTTFFEEDFQNRPGPTPIVRLTGYTGTTGQTYTANPAWLTGCNGWISAANQPVNAPAQVADCGFQVNWNGTQQLAQALGIFDGQSTTDAESNFAVSAYTFGNPGAGLVEFETANNIPFPLSSRYVTFSVDVAAVNCNTTAPLLQFSLLTDTGTAIAAGSQINGCTSPTTVSVPARGVAAATTARVGTYTANSAILVTGSSVGIRMVNNNGNGNFGNDHAFDNIRILDATPQLDKSFSPSEAGVGQTSTLTLTVTNTSELGAKAGWSFTDNLPAGLTIAGPATTNCPSGTATAAVGATSVDVTGDLSAGMTSCTVTVPVTTDTVGTFTNSDANIESPVGINPPGTSTVEFTEEPALTVVKSSTSTALPAVGESIPYSVLVTNSGNVALTAVAVTDPNTGPVTCPDGTLAPGASTTCTAEHTVTQADIDAGQVANTASATGTPPLGDPITQPSNTLVIPATQAPALTVVKSAEGPEGGFVAGDQIAYSFLVTNTGNVTVTNVAVTDAMTPPAGPAPTVSCPDTTLAPGESVTCTAGYTATQADLDNGSIGDSATASGTAPGGAGVTSPPSTASVPAAQTSGLSIVKSASPAAVNTVGQAVSYSFEVTNTGNVTVTNLAVTDVMTAPAGPAPAVSCPSPSLASGASQICTATYSATQADLDNGLIDNTATVSGTTPDGDQVTSPPSEASVSTTQTPTLTLVKSASPQTVTTVGQSVTYTFEVTNTGNVGISNLTVVDTMTAPAGPNPAVSCPSTTLAPGASQTCTTTYSATQADLDRGSIADTATASGTAPGGASVTSPPSSATVPVDRSPELTVLKSGSPTTVNTVGQNVSYTFVVTNTGNVTVTNVAVVDTMTAPAGPNPAVSCPDPTTLAPGASVTCTATYTATQADLNNATIANSAVASGTDPGGQPVNSDPSTATVTATQQPGLTIAKSTSPPTVTSAGATVTYTFVVTNTGNVTVTNLAVTDVMTAPAGPAAAVTCPSTTLAGGASVTCTSTYTVTQADVDNGSIVDTATASGTTPGGPLTSPPSTGTVATTDSPGLSVVKTASPAAVATVGQQVSYTFAVTNTGNVTLGNIAVADTLTPPAGPALNVSCPPGTLAPGASRTCTATYTVTQADLDNGSIENTATATGTSPDGDPVTSPRSTTTVTSDATPALTVVKTASPTTVTAVGQTVSLSFLVTNTGTVTVTDLAVDDTLATPAGPEPLIACQDTTLAPGADTTCTAEYTVTQADVDKGVISDSATVSGGSTVGPVTSEPSTATVTVDVEPGLTVAKTVAPATVDSVGQNVTFSFEVTNTGALTLTDVSVTDTLTAPAGPPLSVSCPSTTLTPGQVQTCTATYVVTQADLDQGSIANTATASGTTPSGDTAVSAPDSSSVDVTESPALKLIKAASPATFTAAGQNVSYSYAVTNTGNVTITSVSVADAFTDPAGPTPTVSCPPGSLAPGATRTCTATYTTTQDDVDNGSINNTATASGTTPSGASATSQPSTATVPVAAQPGISLVKSASPAIVYTIGENVTFTYRMSNTGNTTLTGIAINDELAPPAGPELEIVCPNTALAPGQVQTCTAQYQVTAADADTGSITNSATATGQPPTGPPVTSTPSTTTTVVVNQAPALSVVKTAQPASVRTLGQRVTYTFVVTNTGNVTVTDLTVTDTMTAPAGTASAVSCPATTLEAGDSTTCTAVYTATQADLDNGSVRNTATATGQPPTGPAVTSPAVTDTVPVDQDPALTVVKSATPPVVSTVGQTVSYTFAVTNTGNVTVDNIAVDDTLGAPAGPPLVISCPETTLTPGNGQTCTATYTVTQGDLDGGGPIGNAATASGITPAGDPVTSAPSTVCVAVGPLPTLTIVKAVSPSAVGTVGQQVDFSFTVTNHGNVTLTDIAVTDVLDAPAGPLLDVTCPSTTLEPGTAQTCTARYTVTQADLDNGSIANTATATGETSSGQMVTSPPSNQPLPVTQAPGLSVVKTAEPATVGRAGQVVTFRFAVTNTGNVTLTDLAIADTLVPPAGPAITVTCPATTLAPGSGQTCTAQYTVTQADIDNGSIHDTAVATARTPRERQVTSPPSSISVVVTPAPGLSVVKTAEPATVGRAGQFVTFRFAVTNTGNVTLTNLTVVDMLAPPAGPAITVTCPATTLAPGAGLTCTAQYTVTHADIDNGSINDSAVARAMTPDGRQVTSLPSSISVDVTAEPKSELVLTKAHKVVDVNHNGKTDKGDRIIWKITVRNTGTTTITDIAVTDPSAGPVTCPQTALAPGRSQVCKVPTHTITKQDAKKGKVVNTVTATGNTPTGPVTAEPVSDTIKVKGGGYYGEPGRP